MPLELVVDKLDSVPEPLRGEYTEKDGKFHLNVNGMPDVTGLKSALQAERDANSQTKAALRAWDALGKKPDEVNAMLQEERAKAEAAALKAGKFDEVLTAKLNEQKTGYEKQLTSAKTKADSAFNVARKAIVDTHVTGALAKAKATTEGLDLLSERLGQRVKIEFADDGSATTSILAADGTPMIGSGQGGLATFDDLVKEAVNLYPSLFEATGAGGGGTPPGKQSAGRGKTIKRADFESLPPMEKHSKVKEGYTIV